MTMVSEDSLYGSRDLFLFRKGVFTKIFLQFPKKFWFDTEVRFETTSRVLLFTIS